MITSKQLRLFWCRITFRHHPITPVVHYPELEIHVEAPFTICPNCGTWTKKDPRRRRLANPRRRQRW